jgi:hypothetical protein
MTNLLIPARCATRQELGMGYRGITALAGALGVAHGLMGRPT